MHFLDIPDKIIGDKLLQFLPWNDLLRLRRLCKWTLGITNTYLKDNPHRAPEIEINEGKEKTFDTFTAMGIPTTKIFLDNPSGYLFYEMDPEKMQLFMEDHSPIIQHLRVTKITLGPTGKEQQFLEALPNLRSFEAGCFVFEKDVNSPDKAIQVAKEAMKDPYCNFFNVAFPETFKNLTSLIIGQDREDKAIQKVALTSELMMHCPHLTSISLPFTWSSVKPVNGMDMRGSLPGDMYFLNQYISKRPNDVFDVESKEPLKLYDFLNYHDDYGEWDFENSKNCIPENWYGSYIFLEICQKALKTGLKLANVNPIWFCAALGRGGPFAQAELGKPVVSLIGLDPIIDGLDMPNLEKITIPWTTRCVAGSEKKGKGGGGGRGGRKKPEWPSLKILDITINDYVGFAWNLVGRKAFTEIDGFVTTNTNMLFNFLFEGIVRRNLRELNLGFVKSERESACLVKDIAVPKTEMIVGACPNLKIVRLTNWLGKNKALLKLWRGLEGLEEVTLDNCRDVGDETFFGEDVRNPVFLQLKNLKKLSLKGLDQMPKITDLLFSRVISKMKLTELVLTSAKPIKTISKGGINALLEGPFKDTIEKFPFREWSLAKVSTQEFEAMEKKFRSYEML